jgi:hypothetical protein
MLKRNNLRWECDLWAERNCKPTFVVFKKKKVYHSKIQLFICILILVFWFFFMSMAQCSHFDFNSQATFWMYKNKRLFFFFFLSHSFGNSTSFLYIVISCVATNWFILKGIFNLSFTNARSIFSTHFNRLFNHSLVQFCVLCKWTKIDSIYSNRKFLKRMNEMCVWCVLGMRFE